MLPLETAFYSIKNTAYALVCFQCGGSQSSICNNDTIRDLKRQYQSVCPICTLCFSAGKEPVTRELYNIAAKNKKTN